MLRAGFLLPFSSILFNITETRTAMILHLSVIALPTSKHISDYSTYKTVDSLWPSHARL